MMAQTAPTEEGKQVQVCAWRYLVRGVFGHTVPVYFLYTGLEDNSPGEQSLTDSLYGGNSYHRLCQEVVLGMGGVAMLRALGHKNVDTYHMNEGHAAFLTLALLEEQTNGGGISEARDWDREAVRQRCIFTTHTPAPAGHDQFSCELVNRVLGPERLGALEAMQCMPNGVLNMNPTAKRGPAAQLNCPGAVRLFPPLTEDSSPLAVFWANPVTEEKSRLPYSGPCR